MAPPTPKQLCCVQSQRILQSVATALLSLFYKASQLLWTFCFLARMNDENGIMDFTMQFTDFIHFLFSLPVGELGYICKTIMTHG